MIHLLPHLPWDVRLLRADRALRNRLYGVNATLDGQFRLAATQTPAFLFNGAQHFHFLPFCGD